MDKERPAETAQQKDRAVLGIACGAAVALALLLLFGRTNTKAGGKSDYQILRMYLSLAAGFLVFLAVYHLGGLRRAAKTAARLPKGLAAALALCAALGGIGGIVWLQIMTGDNLSFGLTGSLKWIGYTAVILVYGAVLLQVLRLRGGG